MSKSILFWEKWPRALQWFLYSTGTFIVLLLLYIIVKWWNGTSNIIGWNIISSLNESSAATSTSTSGGLLLRTVEPVFYVTEKYVPTGSSIPILPAYVYLAGFIIGICFILSATLRLRSLWFMVGISVLGIALLGFDLDLLYNQLTNWPFILVFSAVAGTTYYFNSWSKRSDLAQTFVPLTAVFFVSALVIQQTVTVELPFLLLANHSVDVALLLSGLFIFFISHEVIAGILNVTSSSTIGAKNSLWQFIIPVLIYLVNAFQIYLENANRIDASGIIIDPLWLFITSFLLGIWGFKNYCDQTELMSFQQSGHWLYIGGGLITLSTLGYLYATDNNPLIELAADYISITHLVVGVVFAGHVLINFIQLMKKGLPVHRIVFKPPFSRLVLARIVAVFGIAILFAFKNYYSLNQFLAGYYNSLGDYSLTTNDLFLAETYYKKSVAYDEFNHKGNYSLGSLAQSQGDATTAGFYFKQAVYKSPTPYAYVGLSESLTQADLFFDATFVLKEGLDRFPNSNFIATNLSRQFAKSSVLDSNYLYADIAFNNCDKCAVESANLLAFWLENAQNSRLDSIVDKFGDNPAVAVKAAVAGIRKRQRKMMALGELPVGIDSALNVSQFALIYNIITNTASKAVITDRALQRLQEKPENAGYFNDLYFLRAKQNYAHGDKALALQQLSYLTRDETATTKMYDLTLAGWFLNEGVYQEALNYFQKGGDSLSVTQLQLNQYDLKIDDVDRRAASELLQNPVSLTNYKSVLNKAPFNPYIVEKVVETLNKNRKTTEAYKIAFNATQVRKDSPLLWKIYVQQSIKSGLKGYARDGLVQLERLLPADEFGQFKSQNKLDAPENDGFDNAATSGFGENDF